MDHAPFDSPSERPTPSPPMVIFLIALTCASATAAILASFAYQDERIAADALRRQVARLEKQLNAIAPTASEAVDSTMPRVAHTLNPTAAVAAEFDSEDAEPAPTMVVAMAGAFDLDGDGNDDRLALEQAIATLGGIVYDPSKEGPGGLRTPTDYLIVPPSDSSNLSTPLERRARAAGIPILDPETFARRLGLHWKRAHP